VERATIKSRRLLFKEHAPDYSIVLIVVLLCLIGLISVFSASVVKSYTITGGETTTKFLTKQLQPLFLGIFAWIVAYKISLDTWKKYASLIFMGTVALLFLVLIVGQSSGGAQRWLSLGPITIQPTEFIKISFVMYLALWLEKNQEIVTSYKILLPIGLMVFFLSLLILLQPNLSTTIIIAVTAFVMYFVAGANWGAIFSSFMVGIVAVLGLIKYSPYRAKRLFVFLNPETDPTGAGYQIKQALIAVGNGGLFGVGFNQSKQKFMYLPEVTTDAIFPIIAEELGFLRTSVILVLFLALVVKGFKIAQKAPDVFTRLLAVGISTWFLVQIFINIGSMISIVPLTGVPLIFISYGGSSLLISLFSVGILLNISKYTKEEEINAGIGSWWGKWWTHLSHSGSDRGVRKKRS
jgi:cell division protein FtsW